jgi:hypothetical protein
VELAASGELAGGLGLERVQARALNNRATMSGRRILVLHALDGLRSPRWSDPQLSAAIARNHHPDPPTELRVHRPDVGQERRSA